MNVADSSNEVGVVADGPSIGLSPGGMPKGATPPVGSWHVAGIAVELAEVTVGGPTDEPRLSVLTFGVEAL